MDFRLRAATPEDADAVARVYVDSWNAGLASLMPRRVFDSHQVTRWRRDLSSTSGRWRVAETGRAVIAFVGTGPSRDPVEAGLGEVDTIAVAPSAWRSGVGRSLIEAALADLVAGGYRHAILWTLADYHPGSAFYSATGWHASGETRDSGRQIAFRHGLSTEPC